MQKRKKLKVFLIVLVIIIILALVAGAIYLNIRNKQNKDYSVKYKVDGDIYKEDIVDYKDKVDLDELEKEGYKFSGWYIGDKKYDSNTEITDDVVLEAKFEELPNAVYFDDGMGNITKVPFAINSTVKEIIPPTKDGYKFLGWFYNDEKFDFNTKLTEDITLVAKWQKNNNLQPIDLNDYVNSYIIDKTSFTTNLNKQNITVNINMVNKKITKFLNNTENKNIMDNTKDIINQSAINKIVINFQDKKYEISRSSEVKNVLEELFQDLTKTSDLAFEERTLSSLYNKKLTVQFIVNSKHYYITNNSNTYEVNFTSKNIISKEYMDNNSLKSVNFIKVYDVTFNPSNHLIDCRFKSEYTNAKVREVLYNNSHSNNQSGTGLRDALLNFASNPYITKLFIHLPDGSKKEITRGDIQQLNESNVKLISLGNNVLKGMGIKGSITSVKHSDFANKKLNLSVELNGGYALEDGFSKEYTVTISSK